MRPLRPRIKRTQQSLLAHYVLDAELYEVTAAVMQAQAMMDSARLQLVHDQGNVVEELTLNQDAFQHLEQAVSDYLARLNVHSERLVALSASRDQDLPFVFTTKR